MAKLNSKTNEADLNDNEFDPNAYASEYAAGSENGATFDPDADDDGFVFDFTKVAPPKALEGDFHAKIKTATPGESKAKNKKIDVTWLILDGDHEGKTIRDNNNFVFSADNEYNVRRRLGAVGLPDDFKGGLKAIAAAMVDAEALITCRPEKSNATDPATNEPYPDRTRVANIKKFVAGGYEDEDLE